LFVIEIVKTCQVLSESIEETASVR